MSKTYPLVAVAELACALGEAPIEGVWECRIDHNWHVAVRGAADVGDLSSVEVEPQGCMKIELRSFEMAVWFNGWLAGLVGPDDGTFAAGDLANETTFCGAAKKRLADLRVRETPEGSE